MLTNSKEEALNMAFRGEQGGGDDGLEDLTKAIIDDVLRMPGNEVCCDCGAPGTDAVCCTFCFCESSRLMFCEVIPSKLIKCHQFLNRFIFQ